MMVGKSHVDGIPREQPEKLQELLAMQKAFEAQSDVALRLKAGEREPEYAPIYKAVGTRGPGAREDVDDAAVSLLIAQARSQGRQLSDAELEDFRKQAAAKPTSGAKRKKPNAKSR